MKVRILRILFLFLLSTVLFIATLPNLFYKNAGTSKSTGTPGNGSLENAYLNNYKSVNYKYFSFLSYFVMGNGYVHSRLHQVLKDSYNECTNTCHGIYFRLMECSGRKGGKLLLHRTHRNGLSVDFMVPKIKNGRQFKFYDRFGLWHYLLNFDSYGRLKSNKKVNIDFETLGKHIIALDNAAQKNGLTISKIILNLDLKDILFKTEPGKEIKKRGIYFAQKLSKNVNMVHDDHYHVDFMLKK